MDRSNALSRLRQALPALRSEFGVMHAALFGSVARNEAGADSDIDVLVELEAPLSYFDLVRLEEAVTVALGVKADVVPRSAMRPDVLTAIAPDLIPA